MGGSGERDVSTRAVTFIIPKPLWLTSNRHAVNRGHRNAIVQQLHSLAFASAHIAGLERFGAAPVRADWFVHYPKGVRRDKGDASNAQPTTKALLDGLVPRWLDDDGPLNIIAEQFERGANLDRASDHEVRLVLTAQEVPW